MGFEMRYHLLKKQAPCLKFIIIILSLLGLCYFGIRKQTVRWFLENHPDDFHLFGADWDLIYPSLSEKGKAGFDKQYGGFVPDKIDEIAKSKFSLVHENTRFYDYVSEKIYDVMGAGTVPVYSGAPNILDYVPKECFVDFDAFKNYDDLYDFLKKMPDETYQGYLNCISNFMKESQNFDNTLKNTVETVFKHLSF